MRTGNLDLMIGAAIKNFRPEVLTADPVVGDLVAAQTARMWYNSTEGQYKFFNGTEIKALGGDGGSVEGAILADGSVAMTADLELSGPDQSASADNAAVSKKHVETVAGTKQDKITGLTENGVVIAGADSELLTSTTTAAELGYLSGVTSNIQTQFGAIGTRVTAVEGSVAGKLDSANGTLTGDLDADGNTVANLAQPVNPNDAARKIDIDNAIAGIDWLADINGIQTDGTLDPELVAGSRYLILDADTVNPNFGTIAGLADNMIVQYSGTAFEIKFDPTDPEAGGAVTWDKDTKNYRRFDGTAWGSFGGVSDFNAGDGLETVGNVTNVKTGAGIQIVANAVTSKLDAAGGLEDNAGSTRVKLDGATLARSVDGIAVADAGVGYAQLDGTAFAGGLKADATSSKIIIDTAGLKTLGFIDAEGGEVEALTLTGTDPLTDTSVVSKKYVDDAIAAGGGAGGDAKLYLYDKTAAGDAAATAHTFEHNAGEKFGTVTVFDDTGYQIIPDEVVLVDENTLRVELTAAKKVAIAFVTRPKSDGSIVPPVGPSYDLIEAQNKSKVSSSNSSSARYILIDDNGEGTVKSVAWTFSGTQLIQAFGPLIGAIGRTSQSEVPLPVTGTVTATITLTDDTVVERTIDLNITEDAPFVRAGTCRSAVSTSVQQGDAATLTVRMYEGSVCGFGFCDASGNTFRPGSNPSTALATDETVTSVEWRLVDAGKVAGLDLTKFTMTPSTNGYLMNLSTTYDAAFFNTNRQVADFLFVQFKATTSTGRMFVGAYGITGNSVAPTNLYAWPESVMTSW